MCLVLSTLGNVKLWIKWISVQPEKSTMAFGEQICYVSGEMRNDWWENCIMVLKKAEIPWQKPSLAPRVLWFLHLKHFLMKKVRWITHKIKIDMFIAVHSGSLNLQCLRVVYEVDFLVRNSSHKSTWKWIEMVRLHDIFNEKLHVKRNKITTKLQVDWIEYRAELAKDRQATK